MQLTDGLGAQGADMLSDLSLQGSVTLWVSGGTDAAQFSYLKLRDTTNVTTTGNIRKPASGTASIRNRGILDRDVPGALPDPTTIEPETWNWGTVLIGKEDRLQFTGSATIEGVNYSLGSQDGTVVIQHDAHLYTTNTFYVVSGSVNVGYDPANPGNGKVGNVHGNLNMRGGTLNVNSTYTGTMRIWGDFVFRGGAVFAATIDVDGGGNDKVVEMDSMKTIRLNEGAGDEARIECWMRNTEAPINHVSNIFESPNNLVLGAQGMTVAGFDGEGQEFGTWEFVLDNTANPKVGKVRRTA